MSGRRKWEETMMHVVRIAVLAIATSLWPLPSYSQLAPSQAEWISALRNGGHVIVIRHGATHTDQADTDPLHLENVDKQRQLNDEGRTLARSIGEAMHKLKIPVGQVYTSMFNRAVETGKLLGFGEIEPSADFTEGGLVVTPIENNRRAQALRKLTATLPPAGTNVAIVTHKPNILDAFGKDWFEVKEGEASIFKPDGNGGYKVIARLQADEWSKLAPTGAN
jgi:phosphohistidine phosphatase SixA